MPLGLVTPGRDAPDDVNVVIEIPYVKVLAVPSGNLTDQCRDIASCRHLPRALLDQIAHFPQF